MLPSILIPVRNEIRNIAECLESVRWSNDVVVVDSASTDGTTQTAQALGARVIQFHWNQSFPRKKNWALRNVAWKNQWVLILDADERVTPELAAEIQQTLAHPQVDGYYINRRFMFLGQWIRHCGYYPSWNLRLFRHPLGRYEKFDLGDTGSGDNEVHEHVVLRGRSACLEHDLLHYAYPDIATWIEKHNRYSNWEAQVEVLGQNGPANSGVGPAISPHLARRRALRNWSRHLPFRPTLRFLYSYVIKRGFLDGQAGYTFCRLLATYEMLNVYKARELRKNHSKGFLPGDGTRG